MVTFTPNSSDKIAIKSSNPDRSVRSMGLRGLSRDFASVAGCLDNRFAHFRPWAQRRRTRMHYRGRRRAA
jgi:hypothetical protein